MKAPYRRMTSEEMKREIQIGKQIETLAAELAALMEKKEVVSWTVSAGPNHYCEVYKKRD